MRNRPTLITMILTALAVLGLGVSALPAVAGHTGSGPPADGDNFRANLRPIAHHPQADDGSHVTGQVGITRTDTTVRVYLEVEGVTAGFPHAQHIHGVGLSRCPAGDERDDRVDDGLIDTVEGIEDYGSVKVSLTTEGDTSPDSALAVSRFPTPEGTTYTYDRTLTIGEDIPQDVADDIEDHAVVVHGADLNGNGELDLDSGASSLNSDIPLEATVPVACGEITTR